MVTPVKISGKILRREDRSLVSVSRKPKSPMLFLQSEVVTPELRRSEVGEFRNAVDGRRIKELVALRTAQVSLEHRESVIVLLLRGVSLAVLSLEEREVVVCVQERIIAVRTNDLSNQRIVRDNRGEFTVANCGRNHGG